MAVAVGCGAYGQDITYYLNGEFPNIPLLGCLTVLTATSILLFLITSVLIYRSFNIQGNEKKVKIKGILQIANLILGIPITLFSLFVWGMWCG